MMTAHAGPIGPLSGIVELDEKYLGGKPRFQRGVKHPRGKGTKKVCVHVAISRNGPVKAGVIHGDSYAVLAPHVKQSVAPGARIMTDQLQPYVEIGKLFAGHDRVHHGIKEFARGKVHINTANLSMRFSKGPNKALSFSQPKAFATLPQRGLLPLEQSRPGEDEAKRIVKDRDEAETGARTISDSLKPRCRHSTSENH